MVPRILVFKDLGEVWTFMIFVLIKQNEKNVKQKYVIKNIKSQGRSKRPGLGQGVDPRVGPRVPPQAPA